MGYDPEHFLCHASNNGRGLDESLICVVCHSVYDTPMVLDPCGHSFCRGCVASLLDSGHEHCPVCRTPMIEGVGVGVPPNRALKELIDNLEVGCMVVSEEETKESGTTTNDGSEGERNNSKSKSKHPSVGCSWTGKLSEFEAHARNECPLRRVSCPIEGCCWEGPHCGLAQHNAESVALHTELLVASKMDQIRAELLRHQQNQSNNGPSGTFGNGIGDSDGDVRRSRKGLTEDNDDNSDNARNNASEAHPNPNGTTDNDAGSAVAIMNRLDAMERRLSQKDREIHTLKARLLDNWLSDHFFRSWILSKPPYFRDFCVYRPIQHLTGPVSQIIAGIPGPSGTDWEGGLYPLLVTWTAEGYERKEPPKCDFPDDFFHPNVYEGNVHVSTLLEFEGSWDPSITLPELFFCIQQLLVHPNHRGSMSSSGEAIYDPDEYKLAVLRQAKRYEYQSSSSNTDGRWNSQFLERAMVKLQSKIDPEYKRPLQPWENERWENLEEVRWKGKRSFQLTGEEAAADPYRQRFRDESVPRAGSSSSNNNDRSSSNNNNGNGNDDDPNEQLVQFIMTSSTDSSMRDEPPRNPDGEVCECSCCLQGGSNRSFIDKEQRMRYIFGEGA